MAVSQSTNSAEVLCGERVAAPSFTWSDLRVDVGVAPKRQVVGGSFWCIVAAAVLRYRACSPVARWLIPRAASLAVVLVYWGIRLAPYWLNR